ncbi:CBFA2T3 [Cordylochernes scorpioides]|uniref:CBFA2T3 n=1 Tax=Cordylochernes scorpioides TaxID=51811 RepID=A0ABY6JXC6_9ARAC|nr:CBFA2T3 [Cordylochernes scorpioides]
MSSSPGSSSPEPQQEMKSSPPKSVNPALAAQNGGGTGAPQSPRAAAKPRRTPSPSPAEPLNLGSSIRQLGKLKRFLTTLLQFGRDVSPEAGDKVHGLILALVNSTLTIEEFHQKLQDVTTYPLRSFVIPFLKVRVLLLHSHWYVTPIPSYDVTVLGYVQAHLPLLQSELLYFSRLAQQTPQQYLRQHEHLLLDPALHPAAEPFEIFQSAELSKRRSPPDTSVYFIPHFFEYSLLRPRDNGYDDGGPPSKRLHASPPPYRHLAARFEENTTLFREQRYERYERSLHREFATEENDTEDEWKNINTMLNCILGMVEKTKRALAILQHRSLLTFEQRPPADCLSWSRSRHLDGTEYDIKKRSSEMLVHYKEDRVLDVRRRTGSVYMSLLSHLVSTCLCCHI